MSGNLPGSPGRAGLGGLLKGVLSPNRPKEPLFAETSATHDSTEANAYADTMDVSVDLQAVLNSILVDESRLKPGLATEMENLAAWGDYETMVKLQEKDPAAFRDVLNNQAHAFNIAQSAVESNNVQLLKLVLEVGENASKRFLGIPNFFGMNVHRVDWLPSNEKGLDMMETVLTAGADPMTDENGTIMHWVALVGLKDASTIQRQIDLFTLLITRFHADANCQARVNRNSLLNIDIKKRGLVTPLHLLALEASGEVVRRMIDLGADIYATTSDTGDSPLHLAVRGCNVEGVEALLNAGALTDIKNKKGEIPLLKLSRRPSRLDSQKDRNMIIEMLRGRSKSWLSYFRFGSAATRSCCG